MLKKILTKARDARWMWNLLGPVYNHHIQRANFDLFEDIARRAPPGRPDSYLDVGTGRGYVALNLAAFRPEAMITGIDYSITQVRSAERLRRKKGITNCRFRQADAMDLPFADASFAGVLTVGSFKHWPDKRRGLTEIRRVLRPGGWIILSETDGETTDGELRTYMKRLSPYRLLDPLLFWGLRNIIFGRGCSGLDLAAIAADAGFEDIATSSSPTCPYTVLEARKKKEPACI
ncbi:MAG: hypothetical protein CVU61_09875 [Deltaproteobacteria bacterium HGW-Deltaproteobacteria-19]|jgi:SAM-dependent methyltransferase|nr:MAG: hypothetical protein CVU61_09875 [Deltaproteobacteria bacterium HGW-Deltaproteobacteria-19]